MPFCFHSASELLSFLLYYSVSILEVIMDKEIFHHYCLLVVGMHILLGEEITLVSLNMAEHCLQNFYLLYPDIYGKEAQNYTLYISLNNQNSTGLESTTMNVHLLSHLVMYTKAWGPLWTMSCFPFETMNGVLRKHFHGTRDVTVQVQ